MPYDIIIGRDKEDKKRFGEKGLIYLGKGYVKMGQYTSLSNKLFMDVVRSHVILIAGKRGCLIKDVMVFTDKGYKPICEFNEKEDKVLSFNKEKKEFEWEDAELLKYNLVDEELIEIEMKDGRRIILTKEHPLLSSYGKYMYYRRACDLKINDKIILSTTLPDHNGDKASLRIARLLGYILADGTINIRKGRFIDGRGRPYNGTKARIRFYNQSDAVLSQMKEDLEKEFKVEVKRYKRKDCNCEVIETKQQRIANKFIELGIPKGNKSAIIRIPKIVFESSNKFKSEFISALFDCDGYIDAKGRIDYSSKSRKFLEDLQILLTHFSIESVIRLKNAKLKGKIYENYRLFITDNVSRENFKKIGFRNKMKQERLTKHISNQTRKRKTYYPKDCLVCNRIKKIEKIKGIREVYDLSVNKNHSFIANGIISHNSGKSYSIGVIAEELAKLPEGVKENIATLIFDTMGIFWTMKYKNDKDIEALEDWGLESENLPINVWAPGGHFEKYQKRKIPVDKKFLLAPTELEIEDWISIFGLGMIEPVSVLIQKIISNLKSKGDYDLDDIIKEIINDESSIDEVKKSCVALFEAAKSWKIFANKDEENTKIKELVVPGKTSVLDLSVYSSTSAFNIRALVIGLISRKLYNQRALARKQEEMESIYHGVTKGRGASEKKEMPIVWLFIDEAHEFLPNKGKTPATNSLIQILREGRQPGISLVLATQQPGVIHRDVMTQSDLVIAHRLTNKNDIESLNEIMQTYMLANIQKEMRELPDLKGSGIILDDNSERLYPIRVRPRLTWHGGEAPIALVERED